MVVEGSVDLWGYWTSRFMQLGNPNHVLPRCESMIDSL